MTHDKLPSSETMTLEQVRESFDDWFAGTNPVSLDFSSPIIQREWAYQAWKDATKAAERRERERYRLGPDAWEPQVTDMEFYHANREYEGEYRGYHTKAGLRKAINYVLESRYETLLAAAPDVEST